ncbi:MAG: hypothetical protein HKO57_00880, partial [Akkermansiaceae bacterium]|nr:hypothetical protein [Akkermansiaceae bacterium]
MPFLRGAVAFLILLPALLCAREPPRRILFIGNSYTGQIRNMLTRVVAASPHRATHLEFVTPGGKTLEFHAHDPPTLARIRNGNWDLVVLQDQSQTPALFPEKFLAAAAVLH